MTWYTSGTTKIAKFDYSGVQIGLAYDLPIGDYVQKIVYLRSTNMVLIASAELNVPVLFFSLDTNSTWISYNLNVGTTPANIVAERSKKY
jgi:hypothetical protein